MLTTQGTVEEVQESGLPYLTVNYFWAGILSPFISELSAGGIMSSLEHVLQKCMSLSYS